MTKPAKSSEPRTRPCPYCGKPAAWEENPFRPFCSQRCRTTDLGHWAAEKYCIPGRKVESEPEKEE